MHLHSIVRIWHQTRQQLLDGDGIRRKPKLYTWVTYLLIDLELSPHSRGLQPGQGASYKSHHQSVKRLRPNGSSMPEINSLDYVTVGELIRKSTEAIRPDHLPRRAKDDDSNRK